MCMWRHMTCDASWATVLPSSATATTSWCIRWRRTSSTTTRSTTTDGDRETIVNGRRLDTVIPNLKGTDFYNLKEDFEEMAFFELRDHIALMKQRGLEGVRRYEVEMHQRMAQPAALLILTLIGVALSSRKMRGGMGMHLGLGITIAFSYILFVKVAMAFGINSSVSPGLAAWIPNILYCALAVFFLAKAPK